MPRELNANGYVAIYLHDEHLNKLSDQPSFVEHFDRYGLPIVAPMTQRSWWSDRICAEFDSQLTTESFLLDYVIPFIQKRFNATPPSLGLLGTGMGGQGALRFAYKYPDTFPVVVAISPAIDYHLRIDEGDDVLCQLYSDTETARQDTATLHIHPLNWPRHQFFCSDPTNPHWHEGAERLRMKLQSLGVPHESDLDTVVRGRGFTYYTKMAEVAVGFIAERLDRERMRIA